MRFSEGIRLQGAPFEITDCSRKELPAFFAEELGYKVGAEIGVLEGAYAELFCQAGIKMFAVDPWMAFPGQGREQMKQEQQDKYHETAMARLTPYVDRGLCEIVRATSMEAVAKFRPHCLDFVYLDGDHSFPHIAQDLYCWAKTVRPGGMVSGHDYFNTSPWANNVLCHVKAVVDAYTQAFGIDCWWTFGQLDPIKEPDRKERFLSWMWFK